MKRFMFILFLSLLAGCSSAPIYDLPYTLPHLLEQSPLPAMPPSIYRIRMELSLHMLILENGTVGMVKLLNTSGSETFSRALRKGIRL